VRRLGRSLGLPGEVGMGLDAYNLQNQGRTFADVEIRKELKRKNVEVPLAPED
jgi:hypothetical protein